MNSFFTTTSYFPNKDLTNKWSKDNISEFHFSVWCSITWYDDRVFNFSNVV